jgi:hypothetical protein
MIEFLSILPLAQVVTSAPPVVDIPQIHEVVQANVVHPLPGQLDAVPVFNSNSPELVQTEGILLSTFPPTGMQVPSAHLNFPLQGRFDLFAHHLARGVTPDDYRTLYLGVVVYNPSDRPVVLDILQAASYLSQEAPFYDLPSYVANPLGTVFAGPGSRTTNDILRGQRQPNWPSQMIIPAKRAQLLMNAPIPLRSLESLQNGIPLPQFLPRPVATNPGSATNSTATSQTITNVTSTSQAASNSTSNQAPLVPRRTSPLTNGRSVLMYLSSNGPVYLASLAMYARLNPNGSERAPTLAEWLLLLQRSRLAGPRDIPPTPPEQDNYTTYFYGRVAGVAQGSQWTGQLTDGSNVDHLTLPSVGHGISYVLSTVDNGTFGTGQIQSAPMLARYPDTAYRAHGNYGVHYSLSIPLYNNTGETRSVAIMIQTPIKEENHGTGLRFLEPPDRQVFFRGTVRIRYQDDFGIPETRYLHIIQRRGQEGDPLVRLTLPKGDRRLVQVDFIYPPDSTPPQVLTIRTLEP